MLSINDKEFIYIEKYRPKNIQDIVLTAEWKNKILKWIKDGEIPNLLLSSKTPGLGKSSLAHVLINELDAEALFINASLYPNIDLLRNKIKGFASTSSFDGRAKIVVLDESDFLNANSTQPSLRGFIEEYSKNCRFVLTCNYKEKIIKPIQDRLINIDFDVMFNTHKVELIKQMFLRTKDIINNENISFTADDLKYLVKHYYPSSRAILNKVQEFSTPTETGNVLVINKEAIDSDTLNDNLIIAVKNNNFNDMKQKIQQLQDPSSIFSLLYERIEDFEQDKRPAIILKIAQYAMWDSQVRDRMVNALACLVEVASV
jgi:DNA polymerase III delta prime subunit